MNIVRGESKVRIAVFVILALLVQIPWVTLVYGIFNDDENNDIVSPPGVVSPGSDLQDGQPGDINQPVITTPTPPLPPSPVESIYDIYQINQEVYEQLDALSEQFNTVAVSITAFDGDRGDFFTYTYGLEELGTELQTSIDTKYRVASISKIAVAICTMALVDAGLLDIDADISDYLGYSVRNPNYPNTPITARMLMQHTSSICDTEAFNIPPGGTRSSNEQLLQLDMTYRNREPGERYEYTNFGTSVLAAVCELVYGKTFDIIAREILFAPLGIDAAFDSNRLINKDNIAVLYNERHERTRSVERHFDSKDSGEILGHDNHLAQGNLTITTLDFAVMLAMLNNDGVYRNVRILSQESAREINNANTQGALYNQGFFTRLSPIAFMPTGQAYWHTGNAYGLFAQFIYAADGTNRGVVVIAVGADSQRTADNRIVVCNEMSALAFTLLNGEG
ncbi:MAG: beta-lactamase family protein [Oscillospiraceae bacterium]|jgi:CubicO group peptidase (beta-lactamase class C family)|nr:beta-lactamase family protein [Oscillospiraceae bacterium]